MTESLSFFIPGPVKAKQTKGIRTFTKADGTTGAVQYTPSDIRRAADHFAARCTPYAPDEPWAGPVKVALVFWLPRPKATPKWLHEAMDVRAHQHEKRPDLDNMVKLVFDVLKGVFFGDDSQVCEKHVQKAYAHKGQVGTSVLIARKTPHYTSAAEWKARLDPTLTSVCPMCSEIEEITDPATVALVRSGVRLNCERCAEIVSREATSQP